MPLAVAATGAMVVLARTLWARPWAAAIDFKVYRVAAEIGQHHGWNRIYDRSLQFPTIAALWPREGWPGWWQGPGRFWTPFVSPPPVAWLVAPFNAVPVRIAALTWVLLLTAALVAAAWLLSPPAWASRFRYATLLVLGWVAVLAVVSGNVVVLTALGVAVAWRLLESGRQAPAGVVLGLASLKPQVMLLAPVALLLQGAWRPFLAWAMTGAGLLLASVLTLGARGLTDYRQLLQTVSSFPGERELSLAGAWSPLLGLLLSALALVAAGVAVWRTRRHGTGVALALGLIATLLVSPYLNTEDFVLLTPAVWLLLRANLGDAVAVPAVALALSGTFASQGAVLPELLCAGAVVGAVALRAGGRAYPPVQGHDRAGRRPDVL